MPRARRVEPERDLDLDASELGFADGSGSRDDGSSGGGRGDGSGGGDGGAIDPRSLANGSGEPGGQRDATGTAFNPDIHLGTDRVNADGTWRKRKKKKGVSSSLTQSARDLPISTIEMFLVSTHAALANITSCPELELRGSEPNDLAVPISKVAALYNLKVDPRLEAYGMLIIACASVYGAKAFQIQARLKRDQRQPPRPQSGPGVISTLAPAPAPQPTVGAGQQTMATDPNGPIVFSKLQ